MQAHFDADMSLRCTCVHDSPGIETGLQDLIFATYVCVSTFEETVSTFEETRLMFD